MIHPLIEERSKDLPLHRLCQLASVPRSSYYRAAKGVTPATADRDEAVLSEIRVICEEMSGYGSPRVTRELHRRGHLVNHKRVSRLMRANNLNCRRKKRFVNTTDSKHSFRVYPNLAKDIVPTAPNQLWRADITYIRLLSEFVYLAIILDAFSRRVIGWALSRHIDAQLTLTALRMALHDRKIDPGVTHHTDQGVQYACHEYIEELEKHGFRISMSRKGNPYDNAMAESFMKTLKVEEVYINEYRNFKEAQNNIEHFIKIVYNSKRLHSSLCYRTPEEVEALFINQVPTLTTTKTVSAMG